MARSGGVVGLQHQEGRAAFLSITVHPTDTGNLGLIVISSVFGSLFLGPSLVGHSFATIHYLIVMVDASCRVERSGCLEPARPFDSPEEVTFSGDVVGSCALSLQWKSG